MSPVPGAADWMKDVPGDRNLTQLTIPGTHDSHATKVNIKSELDGAEKAIGPVVAKAAQTQDHGVTQQLYDGVRYFDLRVRHGENGDYGLCHAAIRLQGSLRSVTTEMANFLKDHPSETLLVSIKWDQERIEVGKMDDFLHFNVSSLVKSNCIPEDPGLAQRIDEIWTEHKWYTGIMWPHLEKSRGRVILLRRFNNSPGKNIGIDITGLYDHHERIAGNGSWRQTQNPAESGMSYEGRWNKTVDQLRAATSAKFDDGVMYFDVMSDVDGIAKTPRDYARELNPKLRLYLQGAEHGFDASKSRFGVIVTDFCCAETAKQIYSMNFRG